MRTIKLMADYGCFPLWEPSSEEYNVDPNDLPISEELKSALMIWADRYDATLNQDYPPDSGFASKADEDIFQEEQEMLLQQLQKELGKDFKVLKHQYV